MISDNVYGDKSSCYLVNARGSVILSLESQSTFLAGQDNLFTYLKNNAVFSENTFAVMQRNLEQTTE